MRLDLGTTEVRQLSPLTTTFESGGATPLYYTDHVATVKQKFSGSNTELDRKWLARKFTAQHTGYIESVSLWLGRLGSPTGTVFAYIYSNTNGAPDYKISDRSSSVRCADLVINEEGSEQVFTWSQDYPRVEAGRTYWIVLQTSNYIFVNNSTEIFWWTTSTGGTHDCYKYNPVGIPRWTSIGSLNTSNYRVRYLTEIVNIGDANQVQVQAIFHVGNSNGCLIHIETSHDLINWTGLTAVTGYISNNIFTYQPYDIYLPETGNYSIDFPVNASYMRISVRALADDGNNRLQLLVNKSYIG